jgi:D-alanine-D-alanine ligase
MKVIVLHGGVSQEREVSLNSGKVVAKELTNLGHDVVLIDVVQEFYWVVDGKKQIHFKDIESLKPDIIFNALHGRFGEDGKLQSMLDIIGIPYTGTGVLGSALGMNKAKCYELFEKFDIDTPNTYEINNIKELDYLDLPYPLFVKPNDGGSSIANAKVNNKEELLKIVETGLKVSDIVLIQEYLEGQEVTCPVLGKGGHAIALPVGLIETESEFFDYDAKYQSNLTKETFPAPIADDVTKKVQDISVEVHRLLDCKGITRSDFIIVNNRIVFLEINTSPGMTSASLCPKSALANNISMAQLITRIMQDSLLEKVTI